MADFDDLFAGLPGADAAALQRILDHVRGLVPDAEEGRSYGVAALRYRGKPLLGMAAAKEHLSLYPFSAEVLAQHGDALVGLNVSKGTIRFTADQSVPLEVLTRIVQDRVREIDAA